MIKIYSTLIIAGRRTLKEVPDKLKNIVKENLLMLGYNETGELIRKDD